MKKFLISIPDSLIVEQTIKEIQQLNEQTLEYGLTLCPKDIKTIVNKRTEALKSNGRVEFGGGIISQIISSFCKSPYISQYNYVETISDIIETFYYYKNETMEEISDDDLIDFMKNCFDNKCQGDMDLLRGKYLDKVAHNVKYGVSDFFNMDEELDTDYDDENGDDLE